MSVWVKCAACKGEERMVFGTMYHKFPEHWWRTEAPYGVEPTYACTEACGKLLVPDQLWRRIHARKRWVDNGKRVGTENCKPCKTRYASKGLPCIFHGGNKAGLVPKFPKEEIGLE